MPKPFGRFGAGPPYARPAPPMRSFYAPCLPSKRALFLQITTNGDLLHPWSSTHRQAHSLPATPQPSPSTSANSLTAPKPLLTLPQPRHPISLTPLTPFLPPHPCHMVTFPTHVSPERGGRTRGPHPSPCAIFIVRHEPDRSKVRIIF